MGMTDIDDKIINRAKQEQKDYLQLSRYYEQQFLEDMNTLGVRSPTVITRVTEHIPNIISYVQKILSNGYAYVATSGSVYFDLNSYSKYQRFLHSDEPEEIGKHTVTVALSQSSCRR